MRVGIIVPSVLYTNTWYTKYLPLASQTSYDNTGVRYNVSRIVVDQINFDQAKYEAYSPLFLPAAFAISYGLSFAAITGMSRKPLDPNDMLKAYVTFHSHDHSYLHILP